MYVYNMTVRSIYDGDTLRADIDLGFNIIMRNTQIRLFGINTPELRNPTLAAGIAARDALTQQIFGRDLTIQTLRDRQEKYGRYLGVLFLPDGSNVNDWMVANGFAQTYMLDMQRRDAGEIG